MNAWFLLLHHHTKQHTAWQPGWDMGIDYYEGVSKSTPQCWPLNSLWPEIHELRRFVRMVAEWDSILRSLRYWDGLHKDTISPETSRLVESPKIFRAISDHSLSAIFDDIDFLFTSPRGWYRLTPWRYTCRDRLEQEEGLTSTSDGQRLFWWRGMHPLSKG